MQGRAGRHGALLQCAYRVQPCRARPAWYVSPPQDAGRECGRLSQRTFDGDASSLAKEQDTVTKDGEPTTISTKGRHDPCLLPRFVPMGEAMVAIVLADHWLRWKAIAGKISE